MPVSPTQMKERVQALEAKLMAAEEEITPRSAEVTAASEKFQTEMEALRAEKSLSQKEIERLQATIAELESAMRTAAESSLTNIETTELVRTTSRTQAMGTELSICRCKPTSDSCTRMFV